ncbi:serine/threonine-protein kinase Sgk2 [Lineolata rhizophorae]|uniref:Serine/threonine-protein kinase Sgk2 n=1 Tax=Lineolata rhizophorae TaxID=578093 RepID=A0A6A6NKN3_9PEZI|nr:serine/threonine-protein kinase Sgk2 [Lineolata rhizophorae]
MDQAILEIIRTNPIGKGLHSFRDSFASFCEDRGLPDGVGSLDQTEDKGLQNLMLDLVLALQALPACRSLPSRTGRGTLFRDLSRLYGVVDSDGYMNIGPITPLLNAVLSNESDEVVWDKVYAAVTPSTPPQAVPCLDQTPHMRSLVNTSEYRTQTDSVLKEELGGLYAGIPDFYEKFFGEVPGLDVAAAGVFAKCKEGDNPLYSKGGWRGWPKQAGETDVLNWFSDVVKQFVRFAERDLTDRMFFWSPRQNIRGSRAKRTVNAGFGRSYVDFGRPGTEGAKTHWIQVLVPGELKSSLDEDRPSAAWQDIGRCVKKIFAVQDTRHFILGFTLCGSMMRLWEFDRVGGIGSSPFDINEKGLKFVSTVLGYLCMNEKQLGFDPTILESDGKRYVEVERDGRMERLIIDGLMGRARGVVGRATTCWKAHREGDDESPLVIKDSWQYPERGEEGELLREATEKGVVNVARHFYHETVHVDGRVDDVRHNIRKGLDVTKTANYKPKSLMSPPSTSMSPPSISMPPPSTASAYNRSTSKGQSDGAARTKRSFSNTDAALPLPKRLCSSSPTKVQPIQNRVHRRVIVRDYGKPIYTASSRLALLAALEACIEGYQSLVERAGLLQGDISPNNLIVDESDGKLRAFLIDLDLAIREQRKGPSGALNKTGTRVFMAIELLLDEKHSFVHDLESFFWVLFWICVHFDGPDKDIGPTEFESWNYVDSMSLAELKIGLVNSERHFLRRITTIFTPFYQPLVPWVNRLRKVVFPTSEPTEKEDRALFPNEGGTPGGTGGPGGVEKVISSSSEEFLKPRCDGPKEWKKADVNEQFSFHQSRNEHFWKFRGCKR